jgi:hypothetical protein
MQQWMLPTELDRRLTSISRQQQAQVSAVAGL